MKKETIDKIQAFMEDVLPTMYDDVKLVEVKGVNDNHITVGFVCPKKPVNDLLSNMDTFEYKVFDFMGLVYGSEVKTLEGMMSLKCNINLYSNFIELIESDVSHIKDILDIVYELLISHYTLAVVDTVNNASEENIIFIEEPGIIKSEFILDELSYKFSESLNNTIPGTTFITIESHIPGWNLYEVKFPRIFWDYNIEHYDYFGDTLLDLEQSYKEFFDSITSNNK